MGPRRMRCSGRPAALLAGAASFAADARAVTSLRWSAVHGHLQPPEPGRLVGFGKAASHGYAPWQPAPHFAVPTLDGQLAYNGSVGASPLVAAVVDYSDPFMAYMVDDDGSVDDFLSLTPTPSAQFLFLFTRPGQAEKLRSRIVQRMDSLQLGSEVRAQWHRQLHFGSMSLDDMREDSDLVATLPGVLGSFRGLRKYLRYWSKKGGRFVSLPRLDCNFQWSRSQGPNNHSPPNPISAELAYIADGCHPAATARLEGRFGLVLEEELRECSIEEAVVKLGGVAPKMQGVIVMAKQDASRLRVIGDKAAQQEGGGSSAWPLLATMVPFDGELLSEVRADAMHVVYECNETSRGDFVVVGADGHLHEVGHVINPWLRTLGWAGQYWEMQKRVFGDGTLTSRLPATVSIFENLTFQGNATVDLTDFFRKAEGHSKLTLEAALRCPGAWNAACGVWDHVATVTVQCASDVGSYTLGGAGEPGGSFNELARLVTPYRLGSGRWLTDVTPLAPMLRREPCTFRIVLSPWVEKTWLWSLALHASGGDDRGANPDLPSDGMPLFSNNDPVLRQTFNADYNTNRSQRVKVPAGTKRVELYALISGHGEDATGCCEFQASRHVFALGGHEFPVELTAPHDLFGCARPADGVEPNGAGGWWMGRNGWCPGQEVKPFVFDVTAALATPSSSGDGSYEATYAGFMWDGKAGAWAQPAAETGYVLMTSHLAFYT
mmetsp:Transcript_35166/g.101278  ORF Transcript_35166/g.101278 Transcript_35166/m.101278 type:complete len:719 (+) Transcript_35166:58-2214(+)